LQRQKVVPVPGRKPPRLELPDVEEALVRCLLASAGAAQAARAAGLEPADFTVPRYGELYSRILSLNGAADPALLGDLAPGLEPEPAGLEAAVRRAAAVRRCALLRRLRDVMRALYAGAADPDEALARAELLAREARLAGSLASVPERVSAAVERLAARLESPEEGVPYGLPTLDAMTGGLRPGDYVIVAGRTGMGKTSFAVQVAAFAAEGGRRVLFCSLEMCAEEVAAKAVSALTPVSASDIRFGRVRPDDLRAAGSVLAEVDLWISDPGNRTPEDVLAEARRLKEAGGLDLLVVDYVQLLRSRARCRDRVEEVSQVSASLCRGAKELRVPVLAASQLSRAPEQRKDRRPTLSDLRESGALEQDADAVILLYRPAYYDPKAGDAAEIILAKHRHGPTGVVPARFDPGRQVFAEDVPGGVF
jgi:replicative DNA helicase